MPNVNDIINKSTSKNNSQPLGNGDYVSFNRINFKEKRRDFKEDHFPLIKKNWELKNQLENQKLDYLNQATKWWFKLKVEEKKGLEEVTEVKKLEEIWLEIHKQRDFWTPSFWLALFSLIFWKAR